MPSARPSPNKRSSVGVSSNSSTQQAKAAKTHSAGSAEAQTGEAAFNQAALSKLKDVMIQGALPPNLRQMPNAPTPNDNIAAATAALAAACRPGFPGLQDMSMTAAAGASFATGSKRPSGTNLVIDTRGKASVSQQPSKKSRRTSKNGKPGASPSITPASSPTAAAAAARLAADLNQVMTGDLPPPSPGQASLSALLAMGENGMLGMDSDEEGGGEYTGGFKSQPGHSVGGVQSEPGGAGDNPERAKLRREKNRVAARKCRAKKVQFMARMQQELQELAAQNHEMKLQVMTWHRMFSREVKLRESMKRLIQAVWGTPGIVAATGQTANDVLLGLEAGTLDISSLIPPGGVPLPTLPSNGPLPSSGPSNGPPMAPHGMGNNGPLPNLAGPGPLAPLPASQALDPALAGLPPLSRFPPSNPTPDMHAMHAGPMSQNAMHPITPPGQVIAPPPPSLPVPPSASGLILPAPPHLQLNGSAGPMLMESMSGHQTGPIEIQTTSCTRTVSSPTASTPPRHARRPRAGQSSTQLMPVSSPFAAASGTDPAMNEDGCNALAFQPPRSTASPIPVPPGGLSGGIIPPLLPGTGPGSCMNGAPNLQPTSSCSMLRVPTTQLLGSCSHSASLEQLLCSLTGGNSLPPGPPPATGMAGSSQVAPSSIITSSPVIPASAVALHKPSSLGPLRKDLGSSMGLESALQLHELDMGPLVAAPAPAGQPGVQPGNANSPNCSNCSGEEDGGAGARQFHLKLHGLNDGMQPPQPEATFASTTSGSSEGTGYGNGGVFRVPSLSMGVALGPHHVNFPHPPHEFMARPPSRTYPMFSGNNTASAATYESTRGGYPSSGPMSHMLAIRSGFQHQAAPESILNWPGVQDMGRSGSLEMLTDLLSMGSAQPAQLNAICPLPPKLASNPSPAPHAQPQQQHPSGVGPAKPATGGDRVSSHGASQPHLPLGFTKQCGDDDISAVPPAGVKPEPAHMANNQQAACA